MSEFEALPPVLDRQEPPILPPSQPKRPQNWFQKLWAGFVAIVAGVWKYAYVVFKFAKGGKILLTMGSMLVSMWVYALLFGWKFAAGFVVGILVHEMGHVFMAWILGLPVSAPIFIPGFGALILHKKHVQSALQGAIVGIGGPLFGTFAGLAYWGIYGVTGSVLFLALAYITFFMNLFNLTPMYPLDGGWITGAISPYIWIIGLVALLAMFFTGTLHNPVIIILLILSLPRIVTSFRRGNMNDPGVVTTPQQKLVMGVSYVGLCLFLAWATAQTIGALPDRSQTRPRQHIQYALQHTQGLQDRKA